MTKLKDRIDAYAASTDYKIMPKVPLVVCVNGRGFSKLTKLLKKPYDEKFSECMYSTMIRLSSEIEGAIFSYQHNDEIVIIARNDQTPDTSPWYDNRLQKICSISSSFASMHFNECANAVNLNFSGDPVFTSHVFAVPTIAEAINTIISKQQHNFLTSIQFACFYELLKKYDKNTIKDMLNGLTTDEKLDLLKEECNVTFGDYSQSFRRGAACYKIPKMVEGNVKNIWTLDSELPIFTKDQSFLGNIFKNGGDIFRAP
jgi:tRNA(His) guanylyltransferase